MATRKEFDFLVFIARLQPLHDGHKSVIDEALKRAKHTIVLVGSANAARSYRNPFTYEERYDMLWREYKNECRDRRLIVAPLDDYTYRDQHWIVATQRTVDDIILKEAKGPGLHGTKDFKTGLIGFGKDNTSYYLKMFPDWGNVNVDSQHGTFNATDIRRNFFQAAPILPRDIAPVSTVNFMKEFMLSKAFKELVQEHKFITGYRRMWEGNPYPVTFTTVDSVVIQSGHILLVRRRDFPGRGQLALPGGFIDPHETLRDAVIRELKEETRISDHRGEIPPAKLRSFISENRVFDDPHRSSRGRTITHAFLFMLPNDTDLYAVRGDSDAEGAQWYRLSDLDPREMFEDHYHMINCMLGGV